MTKPCIVYYNCLNYLNNNRMELYDCFEVFDVPSPLYDTTIPNRELVEAIFLPLGFKFGAQQLGSFPKLKVIASNTTTRPEVAEELHRDTYEIHIIYLNDPEFLERITATAEHTLGLILAMHRRIPWAHDTATKSGWDRFKWGAPKMLSKSTLTIWGPGRVGTHLANIATAIFENVFMISEDTNDETIKSTLEVTDALAITASMVGPQPIITKAYLECLPRSAIVVNTGRGELLDTDALLDMLAADELFGAALDVLPYDHRASFGSVPDEMMGAMHYAKAHQNLILTPHIAGSTLDAWYHTQRYVIDKVKEILL
jgi:D-3-phosphoglycerate dehydrogenase